MKKFSHLVLIILGITLLQTPQAFGEFKDYLGIGGTLGLQKLYGDGEVVSKFAPSGSVMANYTFRNKNFGIITGLTLGWLESTHKITKAHAAPNLLTLDVMGAFWLLPQQVVNPFIYIGLGIVNFSYPANPPGGRYMDGAFMIGGGMEYMLNAQLGLNVLMDYRYTTGDDFDLQHGGTTDGYLHARAGVTYYFRPRNSNDWAKAKETPLDADLASLDDLDSRNQSDYSTDDFVTIKARIDELNEMIAEKENEVRETKLLIDAKKEELANPSLPELPPSMPGSMPSSMPTVATSGEFSADYTAALERFFAKEYDGVISVMTTLIQKEPQNSLAGNCQYWIGEAYNGKRDYQNAIAAFEKVLNYQNSPKIDDTLIMLGKCNLNVGDKENARKYLTLLLQEHPDSEYIARAEEYLGKL